MNRNRAYLWLSCAALLARAASGASADVGDVLKTAGIKGGLCVVLGSGDGTLAAELAAGTSGSAPGRTESAADGRFIVHGLEADVRAVESARRMLRSRGLYGQVSVERWDSGSLPYADDVVNLVVVADQGRVSRDEIMRVLCPGGAACLLNEGARPAALVKPRPKEMDEWTHWRHGPDRNPVSRDLLIELPRHVRWLSFHGREGKDMVSAGGRCFYLAGDELRARDAFNGLPLWRRRTDRRALPVASAEGVYVVSGGRLVRLDGATGAEGVPYPDAGEPNVILHVRGESESGSEGEAGPGGLLVVADGGSVRALAAGTGGLVWRRDFSSPRGLAAGGGGVFFAAGNARRGEECSVVGLELSSGQVRWERKGLPWARLCHRACCGKGLVAFETGRFAVPRSVQDEAKEEPPCVHFLSAKDGRVVRDYEYRPAMRHNENVRVFFVGGKVAVHRVERDKTRSTLVVFDDTAADPAGEPRTLPALPPKKAYFYCYPPVATERFFIYGQMSFTDWRTGEHVENQITRGTCGDAGAGVIPANGLVYVFPKSCNCFSMLQGLAALAPRRGVAPARAGAPGREDPPAGRDILERGPAYGSRAPDASRSGDWTCLRGDEYRSGSSGTTVPAEIGVLWSAEFPRPSYAGPALEEWERYPFSAGPITPPVVAGGTVYVAEPHTHRVVALDADTGDTRWEFVADGRVDTPPTIHQGLCLFGSRLGRVYCLRASDGELVWRLRAAPDERRIVHCGQLESPWPVPGSVLVTGGVAYSGMGIHPLADGGIRVFAVDPPTGRVKWKKVVTDMGYARRGWHGRAGLEQDYFDLMVRDGDRVALSRWVFDPGTGENEFLWHDAFYRAGREGAWMQRGTWSYGHPMNRPRMKRPLLVCRGAAVLGANKAKDEKYGGPLRLFRRDFGPGEQFDVTWNEQENDTASRIGQYFPANRLAAKATWTAEYPGWIEAMVLAGENLFLYAAGKLRVYSAADGTPRPGGKLVVETPFPTPVWDGMAAAHGRLYVSTRAGRVLCLGAGGTKPLPAARADAAGREASSSGRSPSAVRRPDAPPYPVPPASGAVCTWDGSSDGDGDNTSWDDPANWTGDEGFPDGRGVRVVLNALQGTVELNRRITLGQIVNDQPNNRNNIFRPGKAAGGAGGSFVFDNGESPALIYQRRGRGAQLRMEIHVDMELKSDLVYDFWSQRYAVIDGVVSGPGRLTLRFAGDTAGDLCEIKSGSGPNTYSGGTELTGLGTRVGLFKASKQGAFGTGDLTVGPNARLVVTDNAGGADDRIADTAAVYLAGKAGEGPAITLEAGVEEVVGELHFEGVRQAAGTWGSGASVAEHRDDGRFAGAGVLRALE